VFGRQRHSQHLLGGLSRTAGRGRRTSPGVGHAAGGGLMDYESRAMESFSDDHAGVARHAR
jgi:hypothetical protein